MNDKHKRYFLGGGVILNIILLLTGAFFIFRGTQNDVILSGLPLYTERGEYQEGEKNTFSTDYPEDTYYFAGAAGQLESGVYDITVDYFTDQDDYTISCSYDAAGNAYPAVYAESHRLSPMTDSLACRIWVNSKIDNLDITIHCGAEDGTIFEHDSRLWVGDIKISRDYRMTVLYKTLKLAVLFVLLNAALAAFWNRKWLYGRLCENFYMVMGLVCIFMVSSLLLMGNFSVGEHDMQFHYARIVGLTEGLKNGSFPVKIQPGWLWGNGYAVSVCYGDALLYFPAVLYLLGVPIVYAYKFYIAAVNAGTLFTSYFCFRKISGDQYVGVGCAALYCLSVTRIINLYLRSAVGEYSAALFLPLVLYGVWRIYREGSGSLWHGGLALCLGMTGLLQTHVISTEMAVFFIAVTVLLLIRKMTKGVFLAFCKSVLLTLCLNLGFLVPFLDYATDDLKVFAREGTCIQHRGLSIYELLSFSSTGSGKANDSLDGLNGRIPESLGIAMLIVILLAIVAAVKWRKGEAGEKREFALAAVLGGIALWMSTCYFPYDRLFALPGIKNVIASIQFPWRFLGIAVLFLTYMACPVFAGAERQFGKKGLHCIVAGICLVSAIQALYCADAIGRQGETAVYYDYRDQMNDWGIVMSGEYLLADTFEKTRGFENEMLGDNVQLGVPERKGTQMVVSCQASENASVSFPLFAYRYYQCTDVETKENFPVLRDRNNRVMVELPDHYQGTICVRFTEPWHWRAAEAASLFTLAGVILSMISFRKKERLLTGNGKLS